MRNIVLMTLSLGLGLFSCSTNIPMSTSLDDELVYNLGVNDSITVKLNLDNQLASGSFFQYEKKGGNALHPVEEEMVYNEYVVLEQMLDNYIRYRFPSDSDSNPVQINVALKSATISSEDTENDQVTSMNSLLIQPGTRLYTAEVLVEVTIDDDDHTYKRTIYGRGNDRVQSFPRSKADVNAFSDVLNTANNRVVYFTNQFLRDVGL